MKPQNLEQLARYVSRLNERQAALKRAREKSIDYAYELIEATVGAKLYDYVEWDGMLFKFWGIEHRGGQMCLAVYNSNAPVLSRDRYIPIDQIVRYTWRNRKDADTKLPPGSSC
jgi:hypothetical protein